MKLSIIVVLPFAMINKILNYIQTQTFCRFIEHLVECLILIFEDVLQSHFSHLLFNPSNCLLTWLVDRPIARRVDQLNIVILCVLFYRISFVKRSLVDEYGKPLFFYFFAHYF